MPRLLQGPVLVAPPAVLARPGQAHGAMKLRMLLCLHQGKGPNLQIFSVKEGKKKNPKKQIPSFRRKPKIFMCFRVFFQNVYAELYKRLCKNICFFKGKGGQFKAKNLTISEKYQEDKLQPFLSLCFISFFISPDREI